MRQCVPEGNDGGLLPATHTRAGEDAGQLAVQRGLGPQAAGLVEKGAHLTRHVAEAGRGAEQDGVVVGQFGRRGDGCSLIELGAELARLLLGDGFRHSLERDLGASHGAGAFGDMVGQGLDVTVH